MKLPIKNTDRSENSRLRTCSDTRESGSVLRAEKVSQRIDHLFDALAVETWLPMGFRTALAEEVTRLRASLNGSKPDWKQVAWVMRSIELFAQTYGDTVRDSRAMAHISLLSLELDHCRWSEDRDSPFALGESEGLYYDHAS